MIHKSDQVARKQQPIKTRPEATPDNNRSNQVTSPQPYVHLLHNENSKIGFRIIPLEYSRSKLCISVKAPSDALRRSSRVAVSSGPQRGWLRSQRLSIIGRMEGLEKYNRIQTSSCFRPCTVPYFLGEGHCRPDSSTSQWLRAQSWMICSLKRIES